MSGRLQNRCCRANSPQGLDHHTWYLTSSPGADTRFRTLPTRAEQRSHDELFALIRCVPPPLWRHETGLAVHEPQGRVTLCKSTRDVHYGCKLEKMTPRRPDDIWSQETTRVSMLLPTLLGYRVLRAQGNTYVAQLPQLHTQQPTRTATAVHRIGFPARCKPTIAGCDCWCRFYSFWVRIGCSETGQERGRART